MQLPNSMRALQYKNFRLYFGGQAISLIGTWMQRIAVSWLVYTLTHSSFMLGLVAFAGQIPTMLLSPYAGAYVDRHSRYKTLLITQIASMVQAGILAALVITGTHTVITIIILSIMLGIINAFDTPARQSFMILMVEKKADLPNAIALNSSMVTLARLAGPAVAGILLSSFGEGVCFFMNFLSFIAVIVSLLLMKLKTPPAKTIDEPIWQNLKEGYEYLQNSKGIRSAILLMALISFFVMPYNTLFPVYAQQIFKGNVTTFSWLNSIAGLGALMGAIYVATLRPDKDFLKIITLANLLISSCIILFSYMQNFWLALAIIMLGESGLLALIASTNTYIQTNVAENMRGRVISYYVMAFMGMQPLGSLLVGYLAHKTSAPFTLLIEGIAGIISVTAFVPAFKKAGMGKVVHPTLEKYLPKNPFK
ncbi:MFS transporter [Hydrotalea sandarakina]|jgi:MFS family permease|uniref:Putative MFS family arabinose efflux permease n=1 Tax=Hydrotalea sandarakina TaxID=1004304 RepID=A0A2W7S491_9BACT|nr:MFS transporter [Hydrotalea sandarakina]PZX65660.1 putative MFS family arabinose efflux permease [Hydrotalea sandarakina]